MYICLGKYPERVKMTPNTFWGNDLKQTELCGIRNEKGREKRKNNWVQKWNRTREKSSYIIYYIVLDHIIHRYHSCTTPHHTTHTTTQYYNIIENIRLFIYNLQVYISTIFYQCTLLSTGVFNIIVSKSGELNPID